MNPYIRHWLPHPALMIGLFALTILFPARTSSAPVPNSLKRSIYSPPIGEQVDTYLGQSVAVANGLIALGAPWDDTAAVGAGVVKVFDEATGALVHIIPHPAPQGRDYFGTSVSMAGTLLVVGAPGNDYVLEPAGYPPSAGRAYVYDLAGPTPTKPIRVLRNPTPEYRDFFGESAAISGTVVVIGAPGDNTGGPYAGSAYVFDLAGPNPETAIHTLNNPSPVKGEMFGLAVAVSGRRVVVGSDSISDFHEEEGSAHVYDLDSAVPAVPVLELKNPDSPGRGSFGFSVAIAGTRVVVGAPSDDSVARRSGSVYVYDLAGTSAADPVHILRNPNPSENAHFGNYVAIAGNRVVAIAWAASLESPKRAAYVFDLAAPTPTQPTHTITNPENPLYDSFGSSLAISNNKLVVGQSSGGGAYAFDLTNTDPPGMLLRHFSVLSQEAFGYSIAVSGKWMVVGTGRSFGDNEHRVYVYDLTAPPSAGPVHILSHPNPVWYDDFGTTVAISGNHVVVGASGNWVAGTGKVFVYDMSGATPEAPMLTLENPEQEDDEGFGTSVAISGTRILVEDPGGIARRAYVYDLASPAPSFPVHTLEGTDGIGSYGHGNAVAIEGDIAVVGCSGYNSGAGKVQVYNLASATPAVPVLTIQNPWPATYDSDSFDSFGHTVAVSGTRIAVGALHDDTDGTNAGSVYVYDLESATPTTPIHRLTDPTPLDDIYSSEKFGGLLSMSGAMVLVGASGEKRNGTTDGAAYLYDIASETPRTPVAMLTHPGAPSNNEFGSGVAIDGTTIVVGAPLDDTTMTDKGAVFIFGPPTPIGTPADDALTTTTGATRIFPLANDTGYASNAAIVSIEGLPGATISVDGRSIIVPAGFTGTFTYHTNHFTTGSVTVSAGTPSTDTKRWAGLLRDEQGALTGLVRVSKTGTRHYSAVIATLGAPVRMKFTMPEDASASLATRAGVFTAQVDADGRLAVTVGTLSGSLRPALKETGPTQFNIALRSIDPAIPGGGFARTTVKRDGTLAFVGKLPDGRAVTSGQLLLDNGSFAIFHRILGTAPRAIVAGEFVAANLTATDVTGEIAWVMHAQVSGLQVEGVNTTLTANGSEFAKGSALPSGIGTLAIAGTDSAADTSAASVVVSGKPAKSVLVPTWKTNARTGTFTAHIKDPTRSRAIRGSGIYLPKINAAWGFFPGLTVGGRIELSVP